jgi:hypothetical protein
MFVIIIIKINKMSLFNENKKQLSCFQQLVSLIMYAPRLYFISMYFYKNK